MDLDNITLENFKEIFSSIRNLNLERIMVGMRFRTKCSQYIRYFLMQSGRRHVLDGEKELVVYVESSKNIKVKIKEMYLDKVNFLFFNVEDENGEIKNCHVAAINDDSLNDIVIYIQEVLGFDVEENNN